ncbi:hypothetical protein MUP01_12035 [Candidatus Bathyarchaeota archaeon]|nr:hypothetical protein [Candidatus Bathyarchaeota archaeon]
MEVAESSRVMVTRKEYEGKTESEWKGVTVRTLRELRNGYLAIPAGKICRIYRKRGGFTLETEPCKCCGVRVLIGKVPSCDVTVVEGSKPKKETPLTSREEYQSDSW